mmetsp:Transcript_8414/g.15054  ORF Transcript_8414/g.15054 Transcript_8414/m.15054 type:complete len:327 (-) Transcript_8414:48-1028(-)
MDYAARDSDATAGQDAHVTVEAAGIACMVLFALLATFATVCLLFQPSVTSSLPAAVSSSLRMRQCFMVLLSLASMSRITSLLIELSQQDHAKAQHTERSCIEDFVMILPDLLFLSAFSVVVCSWVKVHFTTHMMYFPILVIVFVALNVGAYVIILTEAVTIVALKLYARFWTYLACSVGALHIIVSSCFAYYGFIVVYELADLIRKKCAGRHIIHRIVLLCAVCPGAVCGRGVAYIAWGILEVQPTFLEKLLMTVVGEWLPSVVLMGVLSPLTNMSWATADLTEHSTESDSPLLSHEQPILPTLSGEDSHRWKQLYPAPSTDSGAV